MKRESWQRCWRLLKDIQAGVGTYATLEASRPNDNRRYNGLASALTNARYLVALLEAQLRAEGWPQPEPKGREPERSDYDEAEARR
ncbi:hypothetical protein [Calidithermus timidus]|uniref:hypothetical protein n=1 Tax=Calidithermus timidus TaxID=307124 RepID=UPI00037E2C3F|nr:hypothetical protein [Calidithermus timidus]